MRFIAIPREGIVAAESPLAAVGRRAHPGSRCKCPGCGRRHERDDGVDYALNFQAALEAPHFTQHTFEGCDVHLENRFSQKTQDSFAALGHRIQLMGNFSAAMGGSQAVLRDFAKGINHGASDTRKNGKASRHYR